MKFLLGTLLFVFSSLLAQSALAQPTASSPSASAPPVGAVSASSISGKSGPPPAAAPASGVPQGGPTPGSSPGASAAQVGAAPATVPASSGVPQGGPTPGSSRAASAAQAGAAPATAPASGVPLNYSCAIVATSTAPASSGALSLTFKCEQENTDTLEEGNKRYPWLIALAVLAVTITSAYVAVAVGYRNWQTAQMNLVAECHKNYGEIFAELFELSESYPVTVDAHDLAVQNQQRQQTPPPPQQQQQQRETIDKLARELADAQRKARRLFLRIWNLQYEEYLYYREGLIPRHIFESWLKYRHFDYRTGINGRFKFGAEGYQKSWADRVGENNYTSDFAELLDAAMNTAESPLAPATDASATRAVREAMAALDGKIHGTPRQRQWPLSWVMRAHWLLRKARKVGSFLNF